MSFNVTASGNMINLLDPEPESLCIEDIAHNLSRLCRWCGATTGLYSVALHSILVTDFMLRTNNYVSNQQLLAGLLHDASEAYLGDVVRPLKDIIGQEYPKLEDRFNRALTVRFKLDPDAFSPQAPLWAADHALARLESQQMLPKKASDMLSLLFARTPQVPSPAFKIPTPPSDPEVIEEAFLAMHWRLSTGTGPVSDSKWHLTL